jgi:hypothetical protein
MIFPVQWKSAENKDAFIVLLEASGLRQQRRVSFAHGLYVCRMGMARRADNAIADASALP